MERMTKDQEKQATKEITASSRTAKLSRLLRYIGIVLIVGFFGIVLTSRRPDVQYPLCFIWLILFGIGFVISLRISKKPSDKK